MASNKKKSKKAVKSATKSVAKSAPKSKVSAKSSSKTAKKTLKKPLKKLLKKPLKKTDKKSSAKSVAKPAAKSGKKAAAKPAVKKAVAVKVAPVKSQTKVSKSTAAGFEPVLDHILVKPDGFSDRTPGGLYIPATAKDKPLKGQVLAVGKGQFNKKGQLRPLDVKVGDSVLYGQYAGTPVTLSGNEFLILKEEDVLGITQS